MFDARYAARSSKWWKSFDEVAGVITVEVHCDNGCEGCDYGGCSTEVEFPMKFEVCSLCKGTGKHVNPDIDSHGITSEEFDNDPEFQENYFSGRYDVQCYNCAGRRVVPEIDETHLNVDQKKSLESLRKSQREEADYARICAAERAMGC